MHYTTALPGCQEILFFFREKTPKRQGRRLPLRENTEYAPAPHSAGFLLLQDRRQKSAGGPQAPRAFSAFLRSPAYRSFTVKA